MKGITKRWVLNTFAVILIILCILIIAFALIVQNFYYNGIRQTLNGRASELVNIFGDYNNDFIDTAREYVENFPDKEMMELMVINENGYVLVQNIDFSKGVSAFNVYAQSSKPMVSLNVYIDDAQTPAGTVTIGTDITKPTTITVSTDITGVHYVYFEAKGGSVTLDGWQAAKAGEQPPVNPPAIAPPNAPAVPPIIPPRIAPKPIPFVSPANLVPIISSINSFE